MTDLDALREALVSAGLPAATLRPAGAGECYRAWWFGDAYIVRVARDEGVDAALEVEMEVLPRLSKVVDAAIPEPVHLGRDPSTGRRVLVHRAVEGETLGEVWPGLSAAERRRIALELGRFLAQLQGVPLASMPVELPEARFHGTHLQTDGIERLVFPRMPAREVAACRAMADGFEPCSREAWTLVHADLYDHHVFVRDRRLSGVIDFGDLGRGDPACDLGTLMDDFGIEFVEELLSDQPAEVARRQLERARFFCVWEALVWATTELDRGREAEVSQTLRRIGRLALDRRSLA